MSIHYEYVIKRHAIIHGLYTFQVCTSHVSIQNTRMLYRSCDDRAIQYNHTKWCNHNYAYMLQFPIKIVSVIEHGTVALHDKQEATEEDRTNESPFQTCKIDPTRYCQSSKVGVTSVMI